MSVITVTAGHSNKDPGAVNGLFREADIAQEMRNMVASYLRQKDIAVKTDGEGKQSSGGIPLQRFFQAERRWLRSLIPAQRPRFEPTLVQSGVRCDGHPHARHGRRLEKRGQRPA